MSLRNRIASTLLGEDSIYYVTSGSRVKLKEDIDFEEDDIIKIKGHNIEIDGAGFKLKGHDHSIQFIVEGDGILMENLTFENFCTKDDNGILIHVNGELNLFNCSFENNYKHNPNGGIITNLNGKIEFTDCKFEHNHNPKGYGGAINNQNGKIILTSCDLRQNRARFGGAIYNNDIMAADMNNFSDNHASKGLSVFNTMHSDLKMGICNFLRESNAHENTSLNNEIYNLGIIHIDNENQKEFIRKFSHGGFLHISSERPGSFKYLRKLIQTHGNKVTLDKDIVFSYNDDPIAIDESDLEIDGCGHTIDGFGKSNILTITGKNIFLKNICFKNGFGEEGSAITNESESLNIENCYFENNISENGGAIKNKGKITASNCNFENNMSQNRFGGAIYNLGTFILKDSHFSCNFSKDYGGAINNCRYLEMTNCTFESNLADNGACIHNTDDAEAIMESCTFENNKAFKQGSIIYNKNLAKISQATASNNVSSKDSNIIYQHGNENASTRITDSTFSRQYFTNNLIFIKNGTCHIESTEFDVKNEDEDSYLIYNDNAIVKFKNTDFNTSQIIYNNNITYIDREDNVEDYIKNTKNGEALKYFTDEEN